MSFRLLERTWQRVDRAYVERWVTELGLEAEWQTALSQAKLPEPPGRTARRYQGRP